MVHTPLGCGLIWRRGNRQVRVYREPLSRITTIEWREPDQPVVMTAVGASPFPGADAISLIRAATDWLMETP